MKRFSVLCLSLLLIAVSSNALAGGGRHHRSGHFGSHGNFVGGLLIGGVISHAFLSRPVRTVVVEQSSTVVSSADQWLLLDLSGRCYSVQRKNDGTEVRREVEAAQCEK